VSGMSKQPTADVDPRFRPVARAFARDPRVVRERSFSPENVLTVKGKMFAMLVRGRFVAKLPKAKVDDLVSRGVGERFDPTGHGRLMKEWIVVEAGKASWVDLAREAYTFVAGASGK
jgi:hypothetical protein